MSLLVDCRFCHAIPGFKFKLPVLALYPCCWWCHTPDISYDWNSIISSKTGLLFCLWACTHSTNYSSVLWKWPRLEPLNGFCIGLALSCCFCCVSTCVSYRWYFRQNLWQVTASSADFSSNTLKAWNIYIRVELGFCLHWLCIFLDSEHMFIDDFNTLLRTVLNFSGMFVHDSSQFLSYTFKLSVHKQVLLSF